MCSRVGTARFDPVRETQWAVILNPCEPSSRADFSRSQDGQWPAGAIVHSVIAHEKGLALVTAGHGGSAWTREVVRAFRSECWTSGERDLWPRIAGRRKRPATSADRRPLPAHHRAERATRARDTCTDPEGGMLRLARSPSAWCSEGSRWWGRPSSSRQRTSSRRRARRPRPRPPFRTRAWTRLHARRPRGRAAGRPDAAQARQE